jgi:hypothetical protein
MTFLGPERPAAIRMSCFLRKYSSFLSGVDEGLSWSVEMETILSVDARMELNLYCLPNDAVHASGFLGQDTECHLAVNNGPY